MDAYHVVGAGGIGCALGYALRAVGCAVTMVEANASKIAAGNRDGLQVEGKPPLPTPFVPFADWVPAAEIPVLLCTKCYDNPPVLDRLLDGVKFIPVQNGFDHRLEARGHALEGIASFVSECPPDRPTTRITRPGDLHLGPRVAGHGDERTLRPLIDSLRRAELFRVVEVPAIEPYKYTKLMYNAAISPLAAAAGIDNGKLLSHPLARRLFFAMLQENYGILAGAGIELGKIGPFHPATVARILRRKWLARIMARAFEPSLRGTYCSMAPDIAKGRTEIDNYNQRLVELAGDRPCPLNRTAVSVIKRMERERLPARPEMLEEFANALSSPPPASGGG